MNLYRNMKSRRMPKDGLLIYDGLHQRYLKSAIDPQTFTAGVMEVWTIDISFSLKL